MAAAAAAGGVRYVTDGGVVRFRRFVVCPIFFTTCCDVSCSFLKIFCFYFAAATRLFCIFWNTSRLCFKTSGVNHIKINIINEEFAVCSFWNAALFFSCFSCFDWFAEKMRPGEGSWLRIRTYVRTARTKQELCYYGLLSVSNNIMTVILLLILFSPYSSLAVPGTLNWTDVNTLSLSLSVCPSGLSGGKNTCVATAFWRGANWL